MVRARVDDEDKLELNCATDLQVPPLLALHVAIAQRCTHTHSRHHAHRCVTFVCIGLMSQSFGSFCSVCPCLNLVAVSVVSVHCFSLALHHLHRPTTHRCQTEFEKNKFLSMTKLVIRRWQPRFVSSANFMRRKNQLMKFAESLQSRIIRQVRLLIPLSSSSLFFASPSLGLLLA